MFFQILHRHRIVEHRNFRLCYNAKHEKQKESKTELERLSIHLLTNKQPNPMIMKKPVLTMLIALIIPAVLVAQEEQKPKKHEN